MSSYGADYSDEEQNYIEHGGASQGESEEGECSGARDGAGGISNASENGGYAEGGERSGSSGGMVHFQAQEGTAQHVKEIPSSASISAAIESVRDDAEGESSGWDAYRTSTANWHGSSAETSISRNVEKHPNERETARSTFASAVPDIRPIGSLTAEEFCERLKLFQTPNVTILVGPDEAPFVVPKDLLCQNSQFFDRAFNGKFKEAAEGIIRLPEDTVLAFQMMLQWIYAGNIVVPNGWNPSETTETYLDFFKLADKIDLLGSLSSMFQKFREHLSAVAGFHTGSDCTEKCTQNENRAGVSCTCARREWSGGWASSNPPSHSINCNIVRHNCLSPEIHMDPLRHNMITSENIHAAFELRPDHEARQIIAQACVIPYMLSRTLDYAFRFNKELDSVDGFCSALLTALASSQSDQSQLFNPLTMEHTLWPLGRAFDCGGGNNGWGGANNGW